jgi:hypothetical protein
MGRCIRGKFVTLGAVSSAVCHSHNESGPAAITNTGVSLAIGRLIHSVGVIVNRAIAHRAR